ncbi:MAG: hypothetical protein G4V63_29660 [Candidatus Afipia apatlaquensis]|uniref:C_GCAxxG_C_C family protein n=1 Tax=Candidatus Afipia apatlaquensis TaxID=2712852 RepID=A0A7C9VSW1_9BRAD|nr:hypothetical protein [Candidatus Afipia apatlaquensis]
MLLDKAKKYYDKSYDLNCAETILYAANEEYNMNLSKETLKTMAAFGGGMAVEGVCGAVSGALASLSILFTNERGHESDRIKKLTTEFFTKFREALGNENCRELKPKYRNDEIRCTVMIETAAKILDEMVTREQNHKAE